MHELWISSFHIIYSREAMSLNSSHIKNKYTYIQEDGGEQQQQCIRIKNLN